MKSLENLGVKEDFTKIEGQFRINVKLKYDTETEINAGGPDIKDDEINDFFKKLQKINDNDTLIISGSIPKSLSKDFYKRVLDAKKMEFTVDIAGEELLDYLPYNPLLVKPNIDELEAIFHTKIDDRNILEYAKKLQTLGAQNVIISLGKDGSIFISDEWNKPYVAFRYRGRNFTSNIFLI